ncbi:hypothetical protein [Pseudoalteromonas fuliginea]|uniref:hypothetical protein n=1 Tax=Pseudoalteromonas fuliginea TaxID=1872678 RepID=UPI00317D05A5
MAYLYGMAIECGSEIKAAEQIQEHFKTMDLILLNNKISTFTINLEKENKDYGEISWWVNIYSNEFQTGEGSPEIARVLYKTLETAPNFRFAIVGVEVLLFISFEDISNILNDPSCVAKSYGGLVLSKSTILGTQSESLFEHFSDNYVWMLNRWRG